MSRIAARKGKSGPTPGGKAPPTSAPGSKSSAAISFAVNLLILMHFALHFRGLKSPVPGGTLAHAHYSVNCCKCQIPSGTFANYAVTSPHYHHHFQMVILLPGDVFFYGQHSSIMLTIILPLQDDGRFYKSIFVCNCFEIF